jgi:hypothetical protein
MILWLPQMFKIMLLRSTKNMYNHSSYLTVECSKSKVLEMMAIKFISSFFLIKLTGQ